MYDTNGQPAKGHPIESKQGGRLDKSTEGNIKTKLTIGQPYTVNNDSDIKSINKTDSTIAVPLMLGVVWT